MANNTDNIIIGAGLTGLSAAFTLLDQGVRPEDILILEALPRCGGRVHTRAENDLLYEYGAQWLHGLPPDNMFYDLLKSRGLAPDYALDTIDTRVVVTADNTNDETFRQINARYLHEAYISFKADHPDEDISFKDLAARTGQPSAALLSFFITRNWLGLDDPADVSADAYYNDIAAPAGMLLKDGMSSLIQMMERKLTTHGVHILTGTQIHAVEQTADNVTIRTPDTSYMGARALITVSAGVLQSGLITFNPPLQPSIKNYINSLIMGSLTKIFVPLQEDFFVARALQPNTHLNIMMADLPVFAHIRTNNKPLITLFAAGANNAHYETASAEDLLSFVRDAFSRFPSLQGFEPYLKGPISATGWASDPHFRGAYSNAKPGVKRSDPMIDNRIIFAGEAFNAPNEKGEENYATMESAWISGQKAAALMSCKPS